MKTLLKGGKVINVFTGEIENADVLMEDGKIIGVWEYSEADVIEDVTGKFICPGFIDGHIHIESTMLTPTELTKLCMPHGTTAIVADPHEIANVCGVNTHTLADPQGRGINGLNHRTRRSISRIQADIAQADPTLVDTTPSHGANNLLLVDSDLGAHG